MPNANHTLDSVVQTKVGVQTSTRVARVLGTVINDTSHKNVYQYNIAMFIVCLAKGTGHQNAAPFSRGT